METELKNKPSSDLLPNEREVSYEEVQQFFARNKVFIIVMILLCVAAVGAVAMWQQQGTQIKHDSEMKLAQAKTPEDLEAVTTQYTGTDAAALATLKLAERYYEQAQWDKASATYQSLLDKYPQSLFCPSAVIGQAAVLDNTGKLNEALEKYLFAAKTYPKSFQAPQALYSAARIQQRIGKLKEAKQTYNDVMINYPDSAWKSDATAQFEKLSQQ
jgi:TolA-binding protein